MSPKLGMSLRDAGEQDDNRDYLASICRLKKYQGATWRQVLETDPEYVRWVLFESNVNLGERLRDELMWALEELE